MFRTLKAEEIECRVQSVKSNGLILLLYKDARVDQRILDETVGAYNWQRDHKELKGNIYCGISIWDKEKGIWITKWDCGAESNTEKEKGEASDSFKRAGFNWGIGRELYTAPFIWVGADKCKIVQNKDKYLCNDKFHVEGIKYDANRNIVGLAIKNQNGNRVFLYNNVTENK